MTVQRAPRSPAEADMQRTLGLGSVHWARMTYKVTNYRAAERDCSTRTVDKLELGLKLTYILQVAASWSFYGLGTLALPTRSCLRTYI